MGLGWGTLTLISNGYRAPPCATDMVLPLVEYLGSTSGAIGFVHKDAPLVCSFLHTTKHKVLPSHCWSSNAAILSTVSSPAASYGDRCSCGYFEI